MTARRISGSRRRRKLDEDEHWIVEDVGESRKAFGMWPSSPEMIPVDIAARAAERAYRRGVVQGAHFMLWHLHPETKRDWRRRPVFLDQLARWRERGGIQEYGKAEIPPEYERPCRWSRT